MGAGRDIIYGARVGRRPLPGKEIFTIFLPFSLYGGPFRHMGDFLQLFLLWGPFFVFMGEGAFLGLPPPSPPTKISAAAHVRKLKLFFSLIYFSLTDLIKLF